MQNRTWFILICMIQFIRFTMTIRRLKIKPEYQDKVLTINEFIFADFKYMVEKVKNPVDCSAICLHMYPCNSVNYVKDLQVCLLAHNVFYEGRLYFNMMEYFQSTTFYELQKMIESPMEFRTNHGKPPPLCGLNAFGYEQTQGRFWPPRQKRIIGGWESRPYDVPFVGIMTKYSKPLCTATLISKNPTDKSTVWGLVAAHCIYNNPSKPRGSTSEDDVEELTNDIPSDTLVGVGFLFGIHDVRLVTPHVVYRTASRALLHPDNTVKSRDVALIKFDKPVKYNSYINGICLPDLHEEMNLHVTAQCFTCGWGATVDKEPPRQGSNMLKCVQMETLGKSQKMDTRSLLKIKSGPSAVKGPYHGDSGSPVFCCIPETPYRIFLYGIVTGGNGVTHGTITTAARIPYYMSWINAIMRRKPSNDENQGHKPCCV